MATNPPIGDGHRNGAVSDRIQFFNPKIDHWVKYDTNIHRIIDVKTSDDAPFKGVRRV